MKITFQRISPPRSAQAIERESRYRVYVNGQDVGGMTYDTESGLYTVDVAPKLFSRGFKEALELTAHHGTSSPT